MSTNRPKLGIVHKWQIVITDEGYKRSVLGPRLYLSWLCRVPDVGIPGYDMRLVRVAAVQMCGQ